MTTRTFLIGSFSVEVEDDIVFERCGQAFDGFRLRVTDPAGDTGDWVEHDHSASAEDVARDIVEEPPIFGPFDAP